MRHSKTVLYVALLTALAAIILLATSPKPLPAQPQPQDRQNPTDRTDRNPAILAAEPAAPDGMMSKPGQPLTTKDLSLDQAHAILAAAIKKAQDINTKMDIAVVDVGGNLKAFVRMDGAWLGSIDIAMKKARTARYFDMPTGEIGKLSQPGKPLYQIEVSNAGLITFPGGVPLKTADGSILGAIGVSGSTVENDHTVAEAGAAAVK